MELTDKYIKIAIFEDLKEKYVYPQELFSMVLGIQKAPINVAKQTHTYKG